MDPQRIAIREQMLAFAAGGERMVARVRLVLIACVFAIPLIQIIYFKGHVGHDLWVGTSAAGLAFVLAIVYFLLARQQRQLTWLSYLTSISDVTIISGTLATFLVLGEPHVAVNSQVAWEVYLLAIAATALRPKRGLVLATTVVAVVQYLIIVLYADLRWNLNAAHWAPFIYGTFSWAAQISRLILMSVAGLLAVGLIREIAHISRLAGTDSLTGTFNRTYFELRVEQEVQRALRYNRSLTLVMVDIDYFKRINDTLGHEFGDRALVEVTQYLKNGLRASDILFRYGGDELAVLMPETLAYDAHMIMQRIIRALHSQRIQGRELTISAGIASLPAEASGTQTLIKAADSHLYAAKDGGRDRIMPELKKLSLSDVPA